jgi:HD-like signal output (HDOD) protein
LLRHPHATAIAPREPIVNLHQAITRLGLSTISEIAVAVSMKGRVFSVPGHKTRLRELWMHSAATAACAKEAALLRGQKTESLFLCGLLHDVGMPLVMQAFADRLAKDRSRIVSRAVLEIAMEEFHQELGLMAIQKWGLGAHIAAVVRHHHDPARATIHGEEVRITALADDLATWALDSDRGPEDFREQNGKSHGFTKDELECLLARRGRVIGVAEAFM